MRGYRDEDPGFVPYENNNQQRTINGARCIWATEKAIKVVSADYNGWIPQAAVHDDSEVYKLGDEGKLILKGWFAVKNGLDLD